MITQKCFEICEHDLCTGCAACAAVCPKKCINMVANSEGFKYPNIDKKSCVSCDKCRHVCVINNKNRYKNTQSVKVISGWSTDLNERYTSSSGGIFPEIAKYVLRQGGVVYGASFDKEFNVVHIAVKSIEELTRIKGSKYYQGTIEDVFVQIKDELDSGKLILFSGTACQIDAVYNYIGGKDYENFITVEIVCHGVPSKKIVDNRIASIGNKSRIQNLCFRDKSRYGWKYSCVFKVNFADGKEHYGRSSTDSFYLGFLQEVFLREACYRCQYVGKQRIGDITLADYWNVTNKQIPNLTNDDMQNGISLIIVNNEKGNKIISYLKENENIEIGPADVENAAEHNFALKENYKRPKNRDIFFRYMETYGYDGAIFRLYPKLVIGIKFRKIIRKIIGENLYSKIKTFLKG